MDNWFCGDLARHLRSLCLNELTDKFHFQPALDWIKTIHTDWPGEGVKKKKKVGGVTPPEDIVFACAEAGAGEACGLD